MKRIVYCSFVRSHFINEKVRSNRPKVEPCGVPYCIVYLNVFSALLSVILDAVSPPFLGFCPTQQKQQSLLHLICESFHF